MGNISGIAIAPCLFGHTIIQGSLYRYLTYAGIHTRDIGKTIIFMGKECIHVHPGSGGSINTLLGSGLNMMNMICISKYMYMC